MPLKPLLRYSQVTAAALLLIALAASLTLLLSGTLFSCNELAVWAPLLQTVMSGAVLWMIVSGLLLIGFAPALFETRWVWVKLTALLLIAPIVWLALPTATQEMVVLLASADGQTLARAQQRSLLGMAALAIALNVLAIVVGLTRPRLRFFTELDQAS